MKKLIPKTKTSISAEQKIFDLVQEIGEILDGDLHVIDKTSYNMPIPDSWEFRVYHAGGFCFDVKKEAEYDDGGDKITGYNYAYYAEWDGFGLLTEDAAYVLLFPHRHPNQKAKL